jgi:biopolymer transport protein ExbB/TolQ
MNLKGVAMFNAMKYTEVLEEAGFTKEQADTSLKVLVEVMDQNFATNENLKITELALRADMKAMESGIRSDMQKMETGIRSDMQKMESKINEVEYKLNARMESLADKTVIRLSGVMVVLAGLFKYFS